MAKRGESGLSLVVGVNKPAGMSSHDVVNRCRRVFGERRVGHTGTLDPLASGVLPICVGPATRLDRYMVGHDKRYLVEVAFGAETTTDDCEGEVTETAPVPDFVCDAEFAEERVRALVGPHLQVPPAYSAVKVNGRKAYEAARAGAELELAPRPVEVFDARLLELRTDGRSVSWVVVVHVSKGTYIRSLARDLGRTLTCPAHVAALERLQAGNIQLAQCHALETLERLGASAALDPVRVLGLRFAFADGCARLVDAGARLRADQLALFDALAPDAEAGACLCTSGICESAAPLRAGELACVLVANRLKAIYRFDAARAAWHPDCVFSTPVARM